MEGAMRLLTVVALLVAAGQLVTAGQLRREPLIVAAPYQVLNRPDSPIELADGQLSFGPRIVERLIVSMRIRRTLTPISDVVIRLAAGLFEDGMVSYRLRLSDSAATPPQPTPPGDPTIWSIAIFERLPDDPLPDLGRVGPSTRFVIAVEQVQDTYGVLIYDNPSCREQLWRALGGS
jgi:hypothetical protein